MGDRARIVVAGPVAPSGHGAVSPLESEVKTLYDTIAAAVRESDGIVDIPTESPAFGDVPAQTFYQLVEQRLRAADAVIVVYAEGRVPAAVEATLASGMVKPTFIIASDGRPVHRLLQGLPSVRAVAMRSDPQLKERVRQFLIQIPRLAMA
jgi:hypothetical protein